MKINIFSESTIQHSCPKIIHSRVFVIVGLIGKSSNMSVPKKRRKRNVAIREHKQIIFCFYFNEVTRHSFAPNEEELSLLRHEITIIKIPAIETPLLCLCFNFNTFLKTFFIEIFIYIFNILTIWFFNGEKVKVAIKRSLIEVRTEIKNWKSIIFLVSYG